MLYVLVAMHVCEVNAPACWGFREDLQLILFRFLVEILVLLIVVAIRLIATAQSVNPAELLHTKLHVNYYTTMEQERC